MPVTGTVGDVKDIHFPKAGIDVNSGFGKQPNRPAAGGVWARTTCSGQNVRVYDNSGRTRGGSRQGTVRWLDDLVESDNLIQHVNLVVTTDPAYAVAGGTVQSSESGRVVTVVAVANGQVRWARPGDSLWTDALNGVTPSSPLTPPLRTDVLVRSAVNAGKMWFADGTNWVYFDPSDATVKRWVASAGTLPVDQDNNAPRLICTWRARTVVSGLLRDPFNVFLSAVDDPTNFDYAPVSPSATDAVALNNPDTNIGRPPDVVTCLIPYSDDVLIIGCSHSIYMLRGDPAAGGQLDLVSDTIGMVWGEPWCKDPTGTVYFFSNRTGVFSLTPGAKPVRVTTQIAPLLNNWNTGNGSIRLAWDDRQAALFVFGTPLTQQLKVNPLSENGIGDHFYYEQRAGAWWGVAFGNANHEPLCCCVLDGNRPEDRVVLLGCRDGYVRSFDPDAEDDDGTAISSFVAFGPLMTDTFDDIMLYEMQPVLAEDSGTVTWGVCVGRTAEAASALFRNVTPVPAVTGTWEAGRNMNTPVRRSGHAIYIYLSATVQWSMEAIRVKLAALGDIRRRGY